MTLGDNRGCGLRADLQCHVLNSASQSQPNSHGAGGGRAVGLAVCLGGLCAGSLLLLWPAQRATVSPSLRKDRGDSVLGGKGNGASSQTQFMPRSVALQGRAKVKYFHCDRTLCPSQPPESGATQQVRWALPAHRTAPLPAGCVTLGK